MREIIIVLSFFFLTSFKAKSNVPTNMIGFFESRICPTGWEKYSQLDGRYIVGTPTGGTNRTPVGVALADGGNRAVGIHSHTVTDPTHTHGLTCATTETGGTDFDCDNLTSAGSVSTSLIAITFGVRPSGSVAGTNAPYIQLKACKKI